MRIPGFVICLCLGGLASCAMDSPTALAPGDPSVELRAQGWAAVYQLDAALTQRPPGHFPVDRLRAPPVRRRKDRDQLTARLEAAWRQCAFSNRTPACQELRDLLTQWRALQAPALLRPELAR